VFDSWGFVDANGTSIDPDDFATAGSASATSSRGRLDPLKAWLRGPGTLYDTNREGIRHGEIQVAMDSLAPAWTNVTQIDVGRTVLLAIALVVLSVTVAYAIDCALNPKECFGSCPTFYVTDGTRDVLAAEGFSSSVAPSLEATDVDALFHAKPSGRAVDITMANEALETHVVRSVRL